MVTFAILFSLISLVFAGVDVGIDPYIYIDITNKYIKFPDAVVWCRGMVIYAIDIVCLQINPAAKLPA